jgi:hypothetical protein
VTETQERFLREIAKRVAPARIAEVHLFAPIRQGGSETGVAVVAVLPDKPVPHEYVRDDGVPDEGLPDEGSPNDSRGEFAPVGVRPPDSAACDPTEAAAGGAPSSGTDGAAAELPPDRGVGRGAPPELQDGAGPAADQYHANAPSADALPFAGIDDADDDELAREFSDPPSPSHAEARHRWLSSAPAARHTIYSARYRLQLKGIDRGKWTVDVTAEADAPLVTVDLVVRGVQRRAADGDAPERLTGDDVRAVLAVAVR